MPAKAKMIILAPVLIIAIMGVYLMADHGKPSGNDRPDHWVSVSPGEYVNNNEMLFCTFSIVVLRSCTPEIGWDSSRFGATASTSLKPGRYTLFVLRDAVEDGVVAMDLLVKTETSDSEAFHAGSQIDRMKRPSLDDITYRKVIDAPTDLDLEQGSRLLEVESGTFQAALSMTVHEDQWSKQPR